MTERTNDPVSRGQTEIEEFARQHGLKIEEARKLIQEHGDDPAKLAEACAKAKVGSQHKQSA